MVNMKRIPEVEQLAGLIRSRGWHRLDQRELELKLGRPLATFERRAFAIARDSRTNADGMKRQHGNRQATILAGRHVKHATNGKGTKAIRPLPLGVVLPESGIDPRLAPAKTSKARWSETKRDAPLAERLHDTTLGTLRPADIIAVRSVLDTRSPIQRHKAEEWDRKR